MPTIGLGELLLIMLVALLVIGPKQLPEAARQLGVFFHNFKRNADVIKDDILGRPEKGVGDDDARD